jgi:DNA-binding GntR family transcriptional regulator
VSDDENWIDGLLIDLDRTGPVPLYFQIASGMERAIRSGALTPGSRLDNEISIGQRLGLSRPTIRRAIQELVDKGLVVRRRGIGTQVVQGTVTRPVELTSLYDDLAATNHVPTTTVLAHEVIRARDDIAGKLGIASGDEVLFLRRTRGADGAPVAVLENYLPADFADISAAQLEGRGLYQTLRARGVAIAIARQVIGARRAHADEAELLGIAEGGPVLTMTRVAFDNAGRAVEFGSHCYRPDRYHFETTVVSK